MSGDRRCGAVKLSATIEALRADAVQASSGSLLGSMSDLAARYGVSIVTLRTAAKTLESEHTIVLRRGVGGGIYAGRIGVDRVAASAITYLAGKGASAKEAAQALSCLRTELSQRAATNSSSHAKSSLQSFVVEELSTEGEWLDRASFIESEHRFVRLLGAAGESELLCLFMQIMFEFIAHSRAQPSVCTLAPHLVIDYRRRRLRLAEAVLQGDWEVAEVAARRCAADLDEWIQIESP